MSLAFSEIVFWWIVQIVYVFLIAPRSLKTTPLSVLNPYQIQNPCKSPTINSSTRISFKIFVIMLNQRYPFCCDVGFFLWCTDNYFCIKLVSRQHAFVSQSNFKRPLPLYFFSFSLLFYKTLIPPLFLQSEVLANLNYDLNFLLHRIRVSSK